MNRVQDIFSLPVGALVTGGNFRDLITLSKDKTSTYWSGPEYVIGNNPRQGINWVGEPPELLAVIIRTTPGSYGEDRWTDETKSSYHYSFKAIKGRISLNHKTNQVLIQQKRRLYPVFLFTKHPGTKWCFEGRFSVSDVEKTYVALRRRTDADDRPAPSLQEPVAPPQESFDFSIPDSWGLTKVRKALGDFSERVIARSDGCCVVCGSSLFGLVDVAHLIPYATDRANRANPGNGICLCRFCHAAFDLRLIAIEPNGVLLVSPTVTDKIARHHFSQVQPKQRRSWLKGVNPKILERTVQWFKEVLPTSEN